MNLYHFKRLINKYSQNIEYQQKIEGQWIGGKWIEGYGEPITMKLAVIPFDLRTISQLGGQVTTSDATVYSLVKLNVGDRIIKNGNKYLIDVYSNFDDYGDFYRYVARGVSEFDKV